MRALHWLALALLSPSFALGAQLEEALSSILLLPAASKEVHTAANGLAHLIETQFGERPTVRRAALWDRANGIRIGPDADHPRFDDDPLTDEILLQGDERGFRIIGSDNTSTIRAIGRFAETILGWHAFQPGALGLEQVGTMPLPASHQRPFVLVEKAGFLSRNPDMQNLAGSADWEHWHGLRERLHYNHSLHAVIPPPLFDSHPEWFAKGSALTPMRPPFYPHPNGHNDHPDLRHPELRETVAASAMLSLQRVLPLEPQAGLSLPPGVGRHFVRLSPGLASLSISLGDSYEFGSFPDSYVHRPQELFRRWQDWSNHVFDYSNAVAASIEQQWNAATWLGGGPRPRLLIGVLAYLLWEDIPDFPLHPSLVPVLTYDRSQWHDPEGRADDLRTVAQWNTAGAPFLATWDYLFGYGFLIPRSLTTVVRDSIPALHERGVQAYFSQVCPVWPYDGHTNWLTAQLLWNPEADSDSLLTLYFNGFHGPAAPAVRSFMDRAESLWMNQKGAGWWLRYWKDPWQAALWSPADLAAMQAELSRARQSLDTPILPDGQDPERFDRRLQRLEETFSLTTAFLLYQWAAWDFQTIDFASLSIAQIEPAVHQARELLRLRKALIATRDTVTAGTPGTAYLSDLAWVFRYDSIGGKLAALALQAGPASPHQATIRSLLKEWAELAGFEIPSVAISSARTVLHDRHFEKFDDPRIWHRSFMTAEGLSVERDTTLQHTVRVTNARRGHLHQFFKAEPGRLYLGQVDATTAQTPAGDVSLILEFYDKEMRLVGESRRARLAPPDRDGSTETLHALATAPQTASFGRLRIRFYELEPNLPVRLENPDVRLLSP
jgi:hypothetical protein